MQNLKELFKEEVLKFENEIFTENKFQVTQSHLESYLERHEKLDLSPKKNQLPPLTSP